MTLNIRKGVFETNSSSSHSISLAPKDDSVLLDSSLNHLIIHDSERDEYVLEIDGGEFGWGEESFNDAETKTRYLVQALIQFEGFEPDESGTDFYSVSHRRREEFENILVKVLKDQLQCDDVLIITTRSNQEDYYWDSGYIDHQSIDDFRAPSYVIFNEGYDAVRRFIFDRRSILKIDNDNH